MAFDPEAEAELLSAARYYEDHAGRLGVEFVGAVRNSCQRLVDFPEMGHPFGQKLRRLLVPGFPYGLVYRVIGDEIVIVAVAHLHRRPGYWRGRG